MVSRLERESLAVKLAEYIIESPKPEYPSYTLIEECNLAAEDLLIAATELASLGIVQVNHTIVLSDVGFSSLRLKHNGRDNAIKFIEIKKPQIIAALSPSPAPTNVYPHTPTAEEGKKMNNIYNIIGSPYGFSDLDWEYIIQKLQQKDNLNVVLGYQFQSGFYNSENLILNLKNHLTRAVEYYNELHPREKLHLNFNPLRSGAGEHLFNQIAREILSADIAFLEVSDRNPNVMIELGVSLAAGVSVVLIRSEESPDPPSDISGHTWTKYSDSASNLNFTDTNRELRELIERAITKRSKRIK